MTLTEKQVKALQKVGKAIGVAMAQHCMVAEIIPPRNPVTPVTSEGGKMRPLPSKYEEWVKGSWDLPEITQEERDRIHPLKAKEEGKNESKREMAESTEDEAGRPQGRVEDTPQGEEG